MTKDDDKWVRDLAWKRYRPLAHLGLELDDLIQEGRISLWTLLQSNPDSSQDLKALHVNNAIQAFIDAELPQHQNSLEGFTCKRPLLEHLMSMLPCAVIDVLDRLLIGESVKTIAEERGVVSRRILQQWKTAKLEFNPIINPQLDLEAWVAELRTELDCSRHSHN